MAWIDELNERMYRIKMLIDASGMSIEEIMAESAPMYIRCDTCPISEFCDQHPYNEVTELGCTDVWKMYLKGESDEQTDNKDNN